MNRWASLGVVAAAAMALGLLAGAGGLDAPRATADRGPAEAEPSLGEQVFVLTMEGNAFNGGTWPDTPLLEAYEGEELTFLVTVPPGAEMHTFHLHGHPWLDPGTGDTIDTVLLRPGETHTFRVTAGLGQGHDGDWLYHCHVGTHFEQGMWGLLRVYPYAVQVAGPLDDLAVDLSGGEAGLEDARFEAHLRADPGPVTAAELGEGQPVDLEVNEQGDGTYRISPDLHADAEGQLVLEAHHGEGTSVARLDLTAAGYELARDVRPGSPLDGSPRPVDAGSGPVQSR